MHVARYILTLRYIETMSCLAGAIWSGFQGDQDNMRHHNHDRMEQNTAIPLSAPPNGLRSAGLPAIPLEPGEQLSRPPSPPRGPPRRRPASGIRPWRPALHPAQHDRGQAGTRLRPDQGAGGTHGRRLQPQSRRDLPDADHAGGARLRQHHGRGRQEAVSGHRRGRGFPAGQPASVDAIQARIDGVARERSIVPDPRIIRAIENLKTALRLRLAGGPIPDEQVRAIAAAIDAAATEAEGS